MNGKAKTGPYSPALDVSTRPKRRKALSVLLAELERIRAAEEAYLSRIPQNLQDSEACMAADQAVDTLTDAIDTLGDVF